MHHRHGEKRVEAGRNSFPADAQATVRVLEPRTRSLRLEARDIRVDRPPPRLAALPHPCGDLGADPASTEALAPPEVAAVIEALGADPALDRPWLRGRAPRQCRSAGGRGSPVRKVAKGRAGPLASRGGWAPSALGCRGRRAG